MKIKEKKSKRLMKSEMISWNVFICNTLLDVSKAVEGIVTQNAQ